jgi:sugar/nucleoside kinase (ribokinase family)
MSVAPPDGRVVCLGPCCLDLALLELSALPERRAAATADRLEAHPGGMANVAVGLARLGRRAHLETAIGDDRVGEQLQTLLAAEGVTVSAPRRGMRTDLTVCMPWGDDRALVGFRGAGAPPVPAADSVFWDPVVAVCVDISCGLDPRVRALVGRGIRLFGDVAWEPEQFCRDACLAALPALTAFLPNEAEALALAGTEDVAAAAGRLGDVVPTVVVKRGARGALARRGAEEVRVAPPPVAVVDSTGAGDVLDAGFVYGTLGDLDLEASVRLGCLAATFSVTRAGSSLSAPSWADLARFAQALPPHERRPWLDALAELSAARGGPGP